MSIAETLRAALPDLQVKTDPDTLETYGRDWTRFKEPAPAAVAFPASVEAVVALVELARRHGIALVPSGGRTGLSGGAVAAAGELVVSLERMNRVLEFDPVDRLVTVEAGMVTQKLQEFATDQGLFYPVDFASKGSSQIGGNIATNAGGIKVLRYGMTRAWVAGLQVVTGSGQTLELNRGLIKNATGYDLRHLFIGSEGTLGIIVAATLELADPPPPQAVMVLGANRMPAVMDMFRLARSGLEISAFEFFSHGALEKVVERHGARPPFDTAAAYYCLVEFDQDEDAALAFFERALEEELAEDGVISQSEAQARALWDLREHISESIAPYEPYKNDLAVRISAVPEFLSELDRIVAERYPDFEVIWFGHIGDGNLHLNILKPDGLESQAFRAACEEVNEAVFELVRRFAGSISAEHGVGLLKKPYLDYSRGPGEIAAFRSIKRVFDPDNVMNPGKLIDP